MTQQAPQQRPQRQRQQGQYPPQQGYQQPQYPPQQAYPPTPQYQEQMPPQAPTQPQRGSSNPIVTGLKWLFWPFLKVGGWILGLFNVIIHEILRSAVRLVFSIILFAIFIAISAAYIIALMQTNYNFSEAIPVMIQNIMRLFGQ